MAEAAIQLLTPLVSSLLARVEKRISLVTNLPEEMNALKDEWHIISAFLESAEQRAVQNAKQKVWVKQLRTLIYDIEDAFEEYHLFLKEGTFGKTMNYMSLACNIKKIHERAVNITESSKFNNVTDYQQAGTSSSDYTQIMITHTMAILLESELVGTKTSQREILHFLRYNNIVAVVGMRGLGKTTVVRSVYNDSRVRRNFTICAWISARQTRRSVDILRSMMKQFYEADNDRNRCNEVFKMGQFQNYATESNHVHQIDSMDQRTLQDLVRSYLKDKRYLLVFDNVKDGYLEKASYIKCLLSTNSNNSKILVTTRNESVAHAWVDGSCESIYKLRRLPYEKAWELFCKKAFRSIHGGRCPSPLHELASGIVRRCEGLPPAILAMGSLLSTKLDDLRDWQKIYDSLGFYLKNNRHLTGIYEILISNYNDLPYNLKPCFLYFGLFPKGDPIDIMKLIRLWIAEGFITEDGGNLSLEEIAEENLNELISMSLVEVQHRDPTERPRTLHIHEFLHEIILSKLHELSFCQILSEKYSAVDEKPRRLSIHKDHKPDACQFLTGIAKCKSSIRSLVVFEPSRDMLSKVLCNKFLKRVHLLKVLDLCKAPIDEIPSQMGKLRNLRFLSLRNTQVQCLPTSIGNLQDLQTLDLKQTRILELPFEISELHKLRHLLSYSYNKLDFAFSSHIQKMKGIKLPEGALAKFEDLQKLAFVDMSHGTSVTTELKNLRQLRRLGIIGLKWIDGKDLCAAIEEMIYLQALNVHSLDKREMIDLNHFESPPSTLKRLYLNGPLSCFPRWILELHNLVKIRLRWSKINESESLEKLHALPNLVELHLLEAYNGVFLEFRKKGFKRLKVLHLLDLHGLEYLLIHEGGLPLLEQLSIGESPNLQVPSGIKYLRRLKTLSLFNMPRNFTDSIQPGEQHYSIVQHVPDVFQYKKVQGLWETCTLG